MLHLILGRSGSGKTRFAIETSNSEAKCGKKVVIIVPEQFTFETERTLVHEFGPQSCLNIEALSFSRLSHRIMSECGGLACRYIDDCGRYVIMKLALKQVSDMLKVYSRQSAGTAFAKAMVDAVGEYKVCGIDADTIKSAADKTGNGLLSQKLYDISLIMRTYNAMLENGFKDPLDDLTRLSEKLKEYRFFEGKTVIFDGFKGFTPQERTVMSRIFSQADDVYVTLCSESLGSESSTGLFSPVEKTARQMVSLANKCGCKVASPVKLENEYRFDCESLKYLEKTVFRPGASEYKKGAPEIHIVTAPNIYDEASFAACEIMRLVREKGCRYGDIVIISRALQNYDGIIDPVFEKYGIPIFYDYRRGIETHPLIALVLSLMDIMTDDFKLEHILRYLKTGLAGFSVEETSLLENYLLVWSIKGGEQWSREWNGSPSGFDGAHEDDGQELEKINILRRKLYNCVSALKVKMESGEMARALYEFLCENGIRDAVTSSCDKLKDCGEVQLAGEYAQIWEKLVSMLDQITIAAENKKLSLKEFAELLRLVVANTDLGNIPPSLDAVAVGDAERIRTEGTKYVFVIGLAEGVFPRSASTGGLISDAERRKLISLGLELSPPADEQAADERFFAYKAFTCASNGVYLSCPRSDAAGKALRPSYFLSAVKNLIPKCDIKEGVTSDPLFTVANEKTAFDLLAQKFGDGSALSQTLGDVFSEKDEYSAKLNALKRASGSQRLHFSNPNTARLLYGESMKVSPSHIETFEKCRFLYFCRYGIYAKPRRKAGLDAPEIGTVIHFVLEKLLSMTNEKGLHEIPQDELDKMVEGLLDDFAKGFLGGLEDKPERFRHLFSSLKDTVMCLVKHLAEEFSQSGFKPADFELSISESGDVAPYKIDLPDGGKLVVGGKVDRVDTLNFRGKTYLRVVDYKTGSKTFNLNDLLYGLNLQMFIYLFTLCDNAGKRYSDSGEVLPAGVLYVPAKKPEVMIERGTPDDKIKSEADKELKMNGIISDEPEIILGMESSGAGKFVPASLKSSADDGAIKYSVSGRSSVASLMQFGELKRYIEKTLKKMAMTIRSGDAAAVPVNGLGYKPCDYCDYSCVCGFEPGCEVKNIYPADKEEIWKMIKGEGTDGTGVD